jgi:hypothetical protein
MNCYCMRQIRKIGLIPLSLPNASLYFVRLGAHVHKSTLRSSTSSLQTLRYTALGLSPILQVRYAGE